MTIEALQNAIALGSSLVGFFKSDNHTEFRRARQTTVRHWKILSEHQVLWNALFTLPLGGFQNQSQEVANFISKLSQALLNQLWAILTFQKL